MKSYKKDPDFKLTWKINLIGIYLIVFMIAQVFIAYLIWESKWNDNLRFIILIGISGGLGGSIYCMREFYRYIKNEQFRINYFWWYIIRPLSSMVMGAFSYLFIAGGLLVLSNSPNATDQKGLMFYCSFAFLVGIAYSRFIEKIYQLAGVLFAAKENNNSKNGTELDLDEDEDEKKVDNNKG